MFLVFEGTDGSGTSTQAKILADNLQKKGISVFHTAEPTTGQLGKKLREYLQKKGDISPKAFQLLFFADREEHLNKEILPALNEGKVVICERYFWSSIAYGVSEGVDQEFLESLSSSFLVPDYTLFFDLDPNISLERVKQRGKEIEYFENVKTLTAVREVFTDLVERCEFTKRATRFDATEPPDQIAARVDMVLTPLLFSEFFEPKQ